MGNDYDSAWGTQSHSKQGENIKENFYLNEKYKCIFLLHIIFCTLLGSSFTKENNKNKVNHNIKKTS